MLLKDRIQEYESQGKYYYSFEYFPPKTGVGFQNLIQKINRMVRWEPLFIDITWGAGGSTSDTTLDLCRVTQNILCVETQMHLTSTNIKPEKLRQSLNTAKQNNIQNILALRGDAPQISNSEYEGIFCFQYAKDLVAWIRQNYGNSFGIAVAGYPEGHPDGEYYKDLQFLKQKIDAGANCVITQVFFQVDSYLRFLKDCRELGITCPILPGILPIISYANLKRIVNMCHTEIPAFIWERLELIKDYPDQVIQFGIQVAVDMCQRLKKAGVKGFHFYTMNKDEPVFQILQQLDFLDDLSQRRPLPWRPQIGKEEGIRPIVWANTVDNYLLRTQHWDKYPLNKWSERDSHCNSEPCDPRYEDTEEEYHLYALQSYRPEDKIKYWKNPESIVDIQQVFVDFLTNKIKIIPWSTFLAEETTAIQDRLVKLNQEGFLTINSQPPLNGVSSNTAGGWGGKNGKLYQKSYLECFVSSDKLQQQLDYWQEKGMLDSRISYCAVNLAGDIKTNCRDQVSAITWGVFPNQEILQPTVADYQSFMVWQRDAFQLWMSEWGVLYPTDSKSYQIIEKIQQAFYLLYLIDHEFTVPFLQDIFDISDMI